MYLLESESKMFYPIWINTIIRSLCIPDCFWFVFILTRKSTCG